LGCREGILVQVALERTEVNKRAHYSDSYTHFNINNSLKRKKETQAVRPNVHFICIVKYEVLFSGTLFPKINVMQRKTIRRNIRISNTLSIPMNKAHILF
jgi:hypothetical protein